MRSEKRYFTDFLVIGSGVAGLYFAIKAASYGKVVVVTKSNAEDSNTYLAQGGVATVLGDDDSAELHIADTLRTGAGLCNEAVVRRVVNFAPYGIRELINLGVNFDTENGRLALGREGGHSRKRIVHVQDFTGKAIEEALIRRAKSDPNIEILQNHMAVDLLTQHQLRLAGIDYPSTKPKCFGAYIYDCEKNEVKTYLAQITFLATGGAGRVYLHTTNSKVATGDGIAMAYRAGARVGNLEFFQFHPTALYIPGAEETFLITEALRGEGAILRNSKGEAFMEKYHPNRELAPRDIVARAIDTELKKSGDNSVFLDVRHLKKDFLKKRFPNVFTTCSKYGIKLPEDWIPVVPAAHYTCGGVVVDENGKTDIENLLAGGEVALTGMHGANRLASNSLLESLAYAHFAFESSKDIIRKDARFPPFPNWNDSGVFDREEWVILSHELYELKKIMWDYMGIVRSDARLAIADTRLTSIYNTMYDFYRKNPVKRELLEFRNLAIVARLAVKCASLRKETRGLHFNSDHPETSDNFKYDTILLPEDKPREEHIETSN